MRLGNTIRILEIAVCFGLFGSGALHAQWVTQEISLRPGWNAVYFEVQPEPRSCRAVFEDVPVESVWLWNRRFSSVQFLRDPSTLVPENPEWLVYLPPESPAAPASNLFTVIGGRAYLVKLAGTDPVDLVVRGRPVTRPPDWRANSYNFVGFAVDPGTPPTFEEFFAPSSAHAGQPAFRLDAAGEWERITSPATVRLRAGEAYWVFSDGASQYSGPIQPILEQSTGLEFGRVLAEQVLRIENRSAAAKTVALRVLPSEPPADDSQPALAGPVPLSYYKFRPDLDEAGWTPFPERLEVSIAPGETARVRLEVRRRDMVAAEPIPGRASTYQSLLEVADSEGRRFLLPVSAKGRQPELSESEAGAVRGASVGAGDDLTDPNAGLWAGMVSIDKVSQPTNDAAPEEPVTAAGEFIFRILLHIDRAGQAKLLDEVILMWRDGTLAPDPEGSGNQVVDEPGRFVLVTDDTLIPMFQGSTVRDGEQVGRRVSTAAYSLNEPLAMTGALGDRMHAELELGFNHPLNPFKHKFHPDHDNLDERFENTLPERTESFTIRREMELEFADEDPDGLQFPGFGDRIVGGVYREVIRGVHKQALHVEGTFRLQHVSRVSVLNDGLE